MGYISDWDEWARAAAAVRARFPDCTMKLDCPADEHPVDCAKAHAEYRKKFPLKKRSNNDSTN